MFELEASQVEGQPLQHKDKKRTKSQKGEKNKWKKQKGLRIGHFLIRNLEI